MAEKGEESLSSTENLVCPLCLDIFEDATLLTCGHTFCRKCLKNYDASHQDLDHMVCPLCRKTTKFSENRVTGLPANVTVNGLVDDYHNMRGGENAFLELRPMCTACKSKGEAISFCDTCNNYMCDNCHRSHQQLTVFFEGHHIVSIKDVMSGSVSIGQLSEKCLVHKHENKDLFCEDCKVHICFKCVIVEHHEHKIKNHLDFEKELRKKVNELIQRCTVKKTDLEKNIQNIESHRHDVHTAVQKLEADVREAYNKKARQLKENERLLIEGIRSLQKRFEDDLDALKAHDRQKIKSITSTATLVANDRLGHLETDSLAAHTLLCDELDGLLKETTDQTSAAGISEIVRLKRFVPADDALIDLGNLTNQIVRVVKEVDLTNAHGIAKKSKDSVAVALYNNQSIDVIDCAGNRKTLAGLPSRWYFDIAIQCNGNIVVSHNSGSEINIHATGGSKLSTIHITSSGFPTLSLSPSDEIVIANKSKEIYIYDPSGNVLKHTVPTRNNLSRQAFVTRSGVIVSSSCNCNPSVLTVYDRNGRAGSSLTANQHEYMYAAADDQDRVYVVTVNTNTGKVLITLYELDHLNLKEKYRFDELELCINSSWCGMVSLSRKMLAFACDKKLYFLEVCA